MTRDDVLQLLTRLTEGKVDLQTAAAALQPATTELAYACIDNEREARCGFPEIVYGAGKTTDQLLGLTRQYRDDARNLLITRVPADAAAAIRGEFPEVEHDPLARTLTHVPAPPPPVPDTVAVVSAGTSDLPVARECSNTLTFLNKP